jgi:signal transduction histidine kinase
MANPMLQEAGIDVEIVPPAESAEVIADPAQLELALLNLVSNSIDAMEPGGKLTVRLARVHDWVHLDVQDTGRGIPPELIAHVFDPWVTTKAPGKGSGLGLSIARQVVLSHGGTIRAENRAGKGAVFSIELPAAQSVRPATEVVHATNPRR